MDSRSIARELALLVLGQISDSEIEILNQKDLLYYLQRAMDSLIQHWREGLDTCANQLEIAQQDLIDSDFDDHQKNSFELVRNHLETCLGNAETILNTLSISLELPRLVALSDQEEIRLQVIQRVKLVLQQRSLIDDHLDNVMEGWRLKRLPRIDRDILRLAYIDLNALNTPSAVACNEAVELANRYSDDQGKRMINGVLRRLQNSSIIN